MLKYPLLRRLFMLRWFNRRMRGIQILFLLIPGMNLIMEIGVRWTKFGEHPNFGYFLLALLVTLGGAVAMFVLDIFWCLFFHHLILAVSDKQL